MPAIALAIARQAGIIALSGAAIFATYSLRWVIDDVTEVLETKTPLGGSALGMLSLGAVLIGAAYLLSTIKRKT